MVHWRRVQRSRKAQFDSVGEVASHNRSIAESSAPEIVRAHPRVSMWVVLRGLYSRPCVSRCWWCRSPFSFGGVRRWLQPLTTPAAARSARPVEQESSCRKQSVPFLPESCCDRDHSSAHQRGHARATMPVGQARVRVVVALVYLRGLPAASAHNRAPSFARASVCIVCVVCGCVCGRAGGWGGVAVLRLLGCGLCGCPTVVTRPLDQGISEELHCRGGIEYSIVSKKRLLFTWPACACEHEDGVGTPPQGWPPPQSPTLPQVSSRLRPAFSCPCTDA